MMLKNLKKILKPCADWAEYDCDYIKPIVEQLIAQNNFRISDSLYQKILQVSGE
jgi:predicted nucleic acid-binding protein